MEKHCVASHLARCKRAQEKHRDGNGRGQERGRVSALGPALMRGQRGGERAGTATYSQTRSSCPDAARPRRAGSHPCSRGACTATRPSAAESGAARSAHRATTRSPPLEQDARTPAVAAAAASNGESSPGPTSRSVCLLAGVPAGVPACRRACLPACLPACQPACLPACLPSCLVAYLPAGRCQSGLTPCQLAPSQQAACWCGLRLSSTRDLSFSLALPLARSLS
jgi:hypothetical protein